MGVGRLSTGFIRPKSFGLKRLWFHRGKILEAVLNGFVLVIDFDLNRPFLIAGLLHVG